MNRRLITLLMASLVAATAAAQESTIPPPEPPSVERILADWRMVHSGGDSLGHAVYVPDVAGSADTAVVFFNVYGQPRAWRAVVEGVRYAHVPTVGLFVVDDSLAAAFSVYAARRHLLEALELLDVIERRVSQPSD